MMEKPRSGYNLKVAHIVIISAEEDNAYEGLILQYQYRNQYPLNFYWAISRSVIGCVGG